MDIEKDYYAVLGVLPSAEQIVIRAAFKALAQQYHPDKSSGYASDTSIKMAELNEAYRVLSSPEHRDEYDYSRGSRVYDASPFFDECSLSIHPLSDPLEKHWNTAIEFYPDLIEIEGWLSNISLRLAYSYKAYLLESKKFEGRKEIANLLEQSFLETYFGKEPSILKFARDLIRNGEKEAAKNLNEAIQVLGSSTTPQSIIDHICQKYKCRFLEEEKLIDAFREGSWETASKLLEKGVEPIGLRDEYGNSLADLAKQRKDKLMLNLLKKFGV